MTRDEIIRMAAQAGFVAYGEDAGEYRIPTPAFHGRLERFAALVSAAEREACAKVCEEAYPYSVMHTDQRASKNCAEAIRARGDEMTEPVTEDGIESAWNACKYRGYCSRLHVENADVMVERDRLRAEVERLREALERAAECGLRDEIHAALKEPK